MKTRVPFYAGAFPSLLLALTLIGVTTIAVIDSRLPAWADALTVDFENPPYTTGTIHNQDGWSSSGAAGSGCAVYDHAVATNTYGYASFDLQSLRISNAVTSGCFGDQTFSKSLTNEAGESTATNSGLSGGVRQNFFKAEWTFASTVPGAEQPGLSVVASPDRGDGARMSYVQMKDTPGGIDIVFYDYQQGATVDPCGCCPPFVCTTVISGLDRSVPHTIKIIMQFLEGPENDIVQVYVDGVLRHTGTSWEDYFRDNEDGLSRTVDSVLFRTAGTPAPDTAEKGFLIDNLSLTSWAADHFVCYDVVEETTVGPKTVALQDQFRHVIDVEVKKAKWICAPADKNGEGIQDPDLHLVCYDIKTHEKTGKDALVTNQFGEQILQVKKPEKLCLPSTKEVLSKD